MVEVIDDTYEAQKRVCNCYPTIIVSPNNILHSLQ